MPRHRPPRDVWVAIRRKIYKRDRGLCQYPFGKHVVAIEEAHIDHIRSGKLGTNSFKNLRTLCRRHHVLRADFRHRGMISRALKDGVIPTNWRELIWEEYRTK